MFYQRFLVPDGFAVANDRLALPAKRHAQIEQPKLAYLHAESRCVAETCSSPYNPDEVRKCHAPPPSLKEQGEID